MYSTIGLGFEVNALPLFVTYIYTSIKYNNVGRIHHFPLSYLLKLLSHWVQSCSIFSSVVPSNIYHYHHCQHHCLPSPNVVLLEEVRIKYTSKVMMKSSYQSTIQRHQGLIYTHPIFGACPPHATFPLSKPLGNIFVYSLAIFVEL